MKKQSSLCFADLKSDLIKTGNQLSEFAANGVTIDLRLIKTNDNECLLRDCCLILFEKRKEKKRKKKQTAKICLTWGKILSCKDKSYCFLTKLLAWPVLDFQTTLSLSIPNFLTIQTLTKTR